MINLIEIDFDGETTPPRKYDLKFLPRIGEKIAQHSSNERNPTIYEVVDIHHSTLDEGMVDVYVHYVGSVKSVIDRIARQVD